ncbi:MULTISPECIES: hypothetical protein [unclassified Microbacterium]|uniref:hypothetical protein n=1 Tax=unclassified Microbacterium TaxID=2609290 RepID=UPI0028833913|nr:MULTISPECIES: hypothetical protein [unclassified Microbacterium]
MTASTSIHIEITHPTHVPVRRHVTIPRSDQLTQDWFDSQTDQSASVRLLIRDEILEHGMGDRVTREKFGSTSAQLAARSGGSAFTAPTPATPTSAASSTAPTPWSVPLLDPRDEEIARLKEQLEQKGAELTSLRNLVGPYIEFASELERIGLTKDGLLI